MIDNWCWCYMVHCIMCYSIKGTKQQNTIFTFFTEGARAHWPLHFLHHFFFDAGAVFTLSPFLHHVLSFFLLVSLSPSLIFTPFFVICWGTFTQLIFWIFFYYEHTNIYLSIKVKSTEHGVNNIMFLFISIKVWFWGMSNWMS